MAKISNPEKKIFDSYTKKDLMDYYSEAAALMLPHLTGRPLSMYRFPEGIAHPGFFQKNKPRYFPSWISHTRIKGTDYVLCNDVQSIKYIASQVAEFHVWTSTKGNLGFPDRMIFDLDPGNNPKTIKIVAKKLKKLIGQIHLTPYLMATGKRGFHLIIPIIPDLGNKEVRSFCLKIAKVIEDDIPEDVTTELLKEKRRGKLFIDVNRNSPDQTSIAPYSVRAVGKATVALPISWGEFGKIGSSDYDLKRTMQRIKHANPWKGFFAASKSLRYVIGRLKK